MALKLIGVLLFIASLSAGVVAARASVRYLNVAAEVVQDPRHADLSRLYPFGHAWKSDSA